MREIVLAFLMFSAGMAGCIGSEDLEAAENSSEDRPATPETSNQEIEFQEEGSFPLYTVQTHVMGSSIQLNDQGPRTYEVPADGTIQAANLTMSWDALTPVMEDLVLALAWDCEGETGCEAEALGGTSPLELHVGDLDEDNEVYVLALVPHQGNEQASLRLSHAQDFQIDGTFTEAVPAQEG